MDFIRMRRNDRNLPMVNCTWLWEEKSSYVYSIWDIIQCSLVIIFRLDGILLVTSLATGFYLPS